MALNFVLAIIKMFDKGAPEDKPNSPIKPKPKRPLKDLVDNVLPWRKRK